MCVSLFYVIDTGSIGPRARVLGGYFRTYCPQSVRRRVTTVVKLCSPNMIGVDSCVFFNLYDKSLPKTRLNGWNRYFSNNLKVLVYVFCSKRIVFRAILRNTLCTPSLPSSPLCTSGWKRPPGVFFFPVLGKVKHSLFGLAQPFIQLRPRRAQSAFATFRLATIYLPQCLLFKWVVLLRIFLVLQ